MTHPKKLSISLHKHSAHRQQQQQLISLSLINLCLSNASFTRLTRTHLSESPIQKKEINSSLLHTLHHYLNCNVICLLTFHAIQLHSLIDSNLITPIKIIQQCLWSYFERAIWVSSSYCFTCFASVQCRGWNW